MRVVHEFIDRSLARSRADWGSAEIPDHLRAQADEVWELLIQLADPTPFDHTGVLNRLDELRAQYVRLYAEAEGIAQSSIVAAGRGSTRSAKTMPTSLRLIRRLPKGVRHI